MHHGRKTQGCDLQVVVLQPRMVFRECSDSWLIIMQLLPERGAIQHLSEHAAVQGLAVCVAVQCLPESAAVVFALWGENCSQPSCHMQGECLTCWAATPTVPKEDIFLI